MIALLARHAKRYSQRQLLLGGLLVLTVAGTLGGGLAWLHAQTFVYTDKAQVAAPVIKLTPLEPGTLMSVNVQDGDWVYAHEPVARVGDEILQTQVSGTILHAQQDIGASYKPGDAVVTMVEPMQLRIVAKVDEDKGLKDVTEGQRATFTVDAFGHKTYEGTVESISDTTADQDVVFNISDKREVKQFTVKIRYDTDAFPELQNGMSARVWIQK